MHESHSRSLVAIEPEADDSRAAGAEDPRLRLDSEQLRSLVGEREHRLGVALFEANAVLDCVCDSGLLYGYVEDPSGEVCNVDVVAPASPSSQELSLQCTCTREDSEPCAHVAALLMAYSAQCATSSEAIRSQQDREVAERVERGRREVIVHPLQEGGGFGVWHARSVGARLARAAGYEVHVRSLDPAQCYCGCPDFAVNQLGTCKHIEAVLHHLRKRTSARQLARLEAEYPPQPLLGLDWNAAGERALRVHALHRASGDARRMLGGYFDATAGGCAATQRRLVPRLSMRSLRRARSSGRRRPTLL